MSEVEEDANEGGAVHISSSSESTDSDDKSGKEADGVESSGQGGDVESSEASDDDDDEREDAVQEDFRDIEDGTLPVIDDDTHVDLPTSVEDEGVPCMDESAVGTDADSLRSSLTQGPTQDERIRDHQDSQGRGTYECPIVNSWVLNQKQAMSPTFSESSRQSDHDMQLTGSWICRDTGVDFMMPAGSWENLDIDIIACAREMDNPDLFLIVECQDTLLRAFAYLLVES